MRVIGNIEVIRLVRVKSDDNTGDHGDMETIGGRVNVLKRGIGVIDYDKKNRVIGASIQRIYRP